MNVGNSLGWDYDISIGDEVGKAVELEVWGKVVSIKMSNMKSMQILEIVKIDILIEVLVIKLVKALILG